MKMAPNTSFWVEAIDRDDVAPPLEGARTADDVVCVGGGYTSLVTACLLKKRDPTLEVTVLERNYVGFGSSGRNAGMVLHEPHLECLAPHGAESVRFTYDETVRTIDFIEELAREEHFDCELERTGYLDIALCPAHQKENAAKMRACRDVGIDLDLLDHEALQHAIRSERFLGALHYPKAATLHPGKYVSGLKQAALRRGVNLYENTPVERLRETNGTIVIETPEGRIAASKAVLGLNAYAPAAGLGVVRDRAVTLFSFIILTEPLDDAHWKEIGWQGRQGYSDKRRIHNYVRLTGQQILFGGRVQYHFGLQSPAALEEIFKKLHRELLATFPSLKDVAITHRWCGPVAITWHRRPMVGRSGNLHFALGYSGMGVSLATLSGRVLSDLIVGNDAPWAELLYLKDPISPLPPEPFRYLGFQAGYVGMRLMDFIDRLR